MMFKSAYFKLKLLIVFVLSALALTTAVRAYWTAQLDADWTVTFQRNATIHITGLEPVTEEKQSSALKVASPEQSKLNADKSTEPGDSAPSAPEEAAGSQTQDIGTAETPAVSTGAEAAGQSADAQNAPPSDTEESHGTTTDVPSEASTPVESESDA